MIDLKDYSQTIRQDLNIPSDSNKHALKFKTTWGLFSPRGIDNGSQMLLDFIDIDPADDCLDMGCGYGVLGLTMAKLAPNGQTLLVDKDFIAV
jgi:16S rRNA (guanine1207-N2)-methyltransferase